MDNVQLQYLPPDLKDRYSKLEQVFNSPGWALIVEFANTRFIEAQNRQLNAPNWDTAVLNRGAAFAYAAVENLRESTEQEFAAIAQANAELELQEDEFDHE